MSGAVALLEQIHPEWTPEQLKSALMSSAIPASASGKAAGALSYGAGRIDVARASTVPVTFSPPSLSVQLARGGGAVTRRVVLTNVREEPIMLTVSVSFDDKAGAATIVPSTERVVVAPGASAGLDITAARVRAGDGTSTGALRFTTPDGSTLRVPFLVDRR